MSIDPWLRELAKVSREKQDEERNRLDERWDRLSSGDLSPEEEAELRTLAETSEEAREAYEAFRPLGPEFHASVVGAIREQGLVPEAESPEETPAKLLPLPKRTAQFAGWGSLAAVAAVLLVMIMRPAAPISSYMAELEGGDRPFRGSAAEIDNGPKVFSPGSLLTLRAEPLEPFERPSKVEARGFAVSGPKLILLQMKTEVAENGILHLRGEIGKEIPLTSGNWKIWIVVCRPGKLPAVDEVRGKLNVGRIQHTGCQATVSEPFEVRKQA